jgi:hypothetical protein
MGRNIGNAHFNAANASSTEPRRSAQPIHTVFYGKPCFFEIASFSLPIAFPTISNVVGTLRVPYSSKFEFITDQANGSLSASTT